MIDEAFDILFDNLLGDCAVGLKNRHNSMFLGSS